MKRFLIIVIMAILICTFPVNTMALTMDEDQTNVYYFEDGSYLKESIQVYEMRASGTKTGSKTQSYYDSNGNLDWKAVLTGTFTYTGASSECTSSICNVTIYDSEWYTVSKSATKSGNTASASVTMGQKLLGVTISKKTTTINLACDANGNLS